MNCLNFGWFCPPASRVAPAATTTAAAAAASSPSSSTDALHHLEELQAPRPIVGSALPRSVSTTAPSSVAGLGGMGNMMQGLAFSECEVSQVEAHELTTGPLSILPTAVRTRT
ncbi:hypothetical protein BU24DRAFT_465055 [Aaosphaeria arxii CBS 175.79]|uniref:Uncharacterized protein n=1 Tax=Aaosphaeria arxii CBS 175.79 TaxID=1450172 RepID=A0A6A5XHH8_9PLEO|nr:uncharacterized protein BU24DRAFT_465055 [Aaosphaeria arxii CBS 175.79]KAF2012688.1 hypothetical protein BU24DRAFT_465055 [Aaosphaeria arxii CBS 175.79]